MVFRSKVDAFFVTLITIAILIIGAATLLPILFDNEATFSTGVLMLAIFILSAGLIVWSALFVKYVFHENYLLVKGGPFRSKIPYQTITGISPTNDLFTGYRILSSRQALELFYTSAILGSVKISPEDKIAFLTELKKRCPNAKFEE